jgi:hypothetical protein
MLSITYTPTKDIIESENCIHIYDFGSYKGFLKNNDFSVYKILHKEMKDTSLYEECEIVEKTPFEAFSIEKYQFIEKEKVIHISNFNIEFKKLMRSSSLPPSSLPSSSLPPPSLPPYSLPPYSLPSLPPSLPPPPSHQTLFDQSLLKQIHQNSKKKIQKEPFLMSEISEQPEQQTLQLLSVRQTSLLPLQRQKRSMIPLEQVLKGQSVSLNQALKKQQVRANQH